MTGHARNAAAVLFVAANLPAMWAAQEPEATVTPSSAIARREMHLGEYARGRALAPSELTASNGSIVITNKTVERLGDRGSLTSGLYTLRPVDRPVIRREADDAQTLAKRQAHWRKLVDAQRDNIVKTETELALLDAKIDSLEEAAFHGGRGAARIWARHDEAKQQRTIVERRLDREKANLAAIVRQARRMGAQPGWFR